MYLIINLGLKSIRGIIFTADGNQVYSRAHPVHTTLFNDRVEQDVQEWNDLLHKILADIRDNTDLIHEISYVSVTTSSSCIFGSDKNLNPLTKVLMVSDKRSSREVEEIMNSRKYIEANKKTNLQCATSSLIPKALWYKNNKPDTFNRVGYWLGAGEYLNYFFTDNIFTDPLNASKAFYSDGKYEENLIESLGISISSLPQVKPIGFTCEIKPDVVRSFGFSKNCQFILTTYDAICAVLGSSIGEPFNACDVSGTVTSVRILLDGSINHNNQILLSQEIDLIKKTMVGSSNNLGGGIIEWCKQAFYNQNDPHVYFQMENSATLSKVGSNGIIFLPYLLGERAPFVAPEASASFFGVGRNSTINDITRAVFESTGYVTRDLIELIERESNIEIKSLTVSGGLARFDLINQIKADICNKPVYVVENFESTSIGAFIFMVIATQKQVSIDMILKKAVKIRKVIHPSEKNNKVYDAHFELYKQINDNLKPLYKVHKNLQTSHVSHENEIVRNL